MNRGFFSSILLAMAFSTNATALSETNPFSDFFDKLPSSQEDENNQLIPGSFNKYKSVIKAFLPFARKALNDQIPVNFDNRDEDGFVESFGQSLAGNSGLSTIYNRLFGRSAEPQTTDGFLRDFFRNFSRNSLFANHQSSRIEFLALAMSLWKQGANRYIGNEKARDVLTKPINMLEVALLMNGIFSDDEGVPNSLLDSLLDDDPLGGLGGLGGIF